MPRSEAGEDAEEAVAGVADAAGDEDVVRTRFNNLLDSLGGLSRTRKGGGRRRYECRSMTLVEKVS